MCAAIAIMRRLKDETRSCHDRLERRLSPGWGAITTEKYRLLLERYYGFYAPFEETAAATMAPAYQPFLARRVKSGFIGDDLRYLGLSEQQLSDLPRTDGMPGLGELQRWGGLYVLEGATLGGQVISRIIRDRLGLAPGAGCSFFWSYGEQIGPMWNEFKLTLESITPLDRQDHVVAGARATFEAFEDWVAG